MSDHVVDSLVIPAPARAIMAAVRDLEAYPEWVERLVEVELLDTDEDDRPLLARFRLDGRVMELVYTLRYDHADDRIAWQLSEPGDVITQMDGSYQLEEAADGTLVRYDLEVSTALPLPEYMRKRAARLVLETSLTGLRDRVVSATGEETP